MENQKLRFGLFAFDSPTQVEWVQKARKVEDLGYDILLAGDHTFSALSPFPALLAAADATKTLRIGTYVLGNDFYNPVMLAREAVTLDILSEGRFELGLGTGWLVSDYKNYGIALDPPGVRIERLKEAVKIIKTAFQGEEFSFQGKYYQVEHFKLPSKPVQQPRLPLLLGGGGKRMLSFAACEADIVGLNPLTTPAGWIDLTTSSESATLEKLNWVKAAAGERSGLELSIYFMVTKITNTFAERDAELAKIRTDWGLSEDQVSQEDLIQSPHFLIGSKSEIIEKIQRLRDQFGITYFVFWEPLETGSEILKSLKT